MQEFPNLSEARPTFTLPAGERARLEAAFRDHMGAVSQFAGTVPTSGALPCHEGAAPVWHETTRRGIRFMPQDRTPVGGYFALPTAGKKHSKLALWLARIFKTKTGRKSAGK